RNQNPSHRNNDEPHFRCAVNLPHEPVSIGIPRIGSKLATSARPKVDRIYWEKSSSPRLILVRQGVCRIKAQNSVSIATE
ncbi:MAG TPA: hypothetical protein VGQ40_07760, partial [Chthoniobacterales bacterium]|nr:hypothetical protein [Chthoniobacterales bacterium]